MTRRAKMTERVADDLQHVAELLARSQSLHARIP